MIRIGAATMLVILVLTVGYTTSGATLPIAEHSGQSMAHCSAAVLGHAKITRAEIASCKGYSFNTDSYCPKGAGVTVVKLNKHTYILQLGRLPSRDKFPSAEKMLVLGEEICAGRVREQPTPFHFSS